MRFVKINSTIYDYSDYKLNVSNISKSLNEEIDNAVIKLGFVKQRENKFYNKKYDLLLAVTIKNRSKLKFV